MNQDLHFPLRQWCQSLNAVSYSVGAHNNALCEVDNPSDSDDETDGDAAAAEPQEQHTQSHSLTTMQSCVKCASLSHVNRVWHWCLAAIADSANPAQTRFTA